MPPRSSSAVLLENVTETGSGAARELRGGGRATFQAIGQTTAGAGAATVLVQASNIPAPSADTDWVTLGTIQLTLSTTPASDAFALDAPWRRVRGRVSALSGTGASVSLYIGA